MTQATVKAVEPKRTQGGKQYWRVNLSGVGWASTWSSTAAKLLEDNIGSDVDVETEKKGNFTNITSAKSLALASSQDEPSHDGSLAVRNAALTAALQRYAGATVPDQQIINCAQTFADWLGGEPEPPEPFDPDEIPA